MLSANLLKLLFLFFAVFTVASAAGIVLNRNAVNSAMCLLLCLVGVAGLFVSLDAYLLAFLLLLVYAGVVACWFLNEGLLIGHARALGLRWEGGFRGVLNLTPDKPFSTRL